MSKFAKTAIAAAMVMGAVVSSSAFAAGNNGTARFYGTIEDSPCSIVPDDHKLEVDMGDIGAAKLTGGGTTTPKDFQIRLQDCVFTTETNIETTFTGTNYAGPANTDNYALFNVDSGVAMNHVSLVIGDTHGKGYKVGEKIVQPIVMDTSTSKGKDKQTLNFKAWLVGETDAPDLGQFETLTTFQITYLCCGVIQHATDLRLFHKRICVCLITQIFGCGESPAILRWQSLVDQSMHGLMIQFNLTPVSLS